MIVDRLGYANEFMLDVTKRFTNRVQLTSDGHKPYLKAVEGAFGWDVDFAVLVKQYGRYVKRQNLTMRMKIRRITRLTNAFSKKIENHAYAIALHFMHYNFCRIHQALQSTPAMKAGVTDHVWTIEEMVDLLRVYNLA